MAKLDVRQEILNNQNDISLPVLEKIFGHYDKQLKTIDNRRISQITTLATTATTSEIISKINEIITALNGSEFTND